MNSSRDSAGSMRPKFTARRATIGSPYRVTFSYAMTAACFISQCGSEYERFTRCLASGSTHSGSMRAFTRAHSLLVSTSSADMSQRGFFLNSTDPGKMANRPPRAPR